MSEPHYILFFDTETNGLPKRRVAPLSDFDNYPRIVQVAWELYSVQSNVFTRIEQHSFILKLPKDTVWNEESSKIHSITAERSEREGILGDEVYERLKKTIAKATIIVAHNLAFDKPMLQCEYVRLNLQEDFHWWPKIEYCTMTKTTSLLKLPSTSKFIKKNDPYKYPKLQELYAYLFPEPHTLQFHSADVDVASLVRCFQELVSRNFITL
jgi:DNA polymerase III epsilon subunit-like protein